MTPVGAKIFTYYGIYSIVSLIQRVCQERFHCIVYNAPYKGIWLNCSYVVGLDTLLYLFVQ